MLLPELILWVSILSLVGSLGMFSLLLLDS